MNHLVCSVAAVVCDLNLVIDLPIEFVVRTKDLWDPMSWYAGYVG